MLNRREFCGHLGAGAAALAIGSSFAFEACSTSWITTALNDLPVVTNIAITVATIVADAVGGGVISPAVAAAIQTASTAIQVALATVQQLVNDYNLNPSASIISKIQDALTTVQANLNQILDAAHVFNAPLRATISGIIGLALTVVAALISILPVSPAPAGLKQARLKMKVPKPHDVIKQANAILEANGYGKYDLHD